MKSEQSLLNNFYTDIRMVMYNMRDETDPMKTIAYEKRILDLIEKYAERISIKGT